MRPARVIGVNEYSTVLEEEMIAFGQTMKNFNGTHHTKKSKTALLLEKENPLL